MKFYLSSYKVGNQHEKLVELANGATIGLIPNALDHAEDSGFTESQQKNMKDLTDLGMPVEYLDLKKYFGKQAELQNKINSLGGIRIRGGNVFVLRQALALSGLDNILWNMQREEFLYGGYSGGPCVAGPTVTCYNIVDDSSQQPYGDYDIIREGLGLLPYNIMPHYRSDHHESALIDEEVEFAIKNKISIKTLTDGEVIVIE